MRTSCRRGEGGVPADLEEEWGHPLSSNAQSSCKASKVSKVSKASNSSKVSKASKDSKDSKDIKASKTSKASKASKSSKEKKEGDPLPSSASTQHAGSKGKGKGGRPQ